MRAATYGMTALSVLLWSFPIGVFLWAMLTIYQRGFALPTTIVWYIAPAFDSVVLLPIIGLTFSLVVPPVLRRLKCDRLALASAAAALIGALAFVVVMPSIERPAPTATLKFPPRNP